MKTAITLFTGVLTIMFVMPIWFYLQYKILSMIGASDLMWFMFWIYVPALFLSAALGQVLRALADD